jgi:hypothetical protein
VQFDYYHDPSNFNKISTRLKTEEEEPSDEELTEESTEEESIEEGPTEEKPIEEVPPTSQLQDLQPGEDSPLSKSFSETDTYDTMRTELSQDGRNAPGIIQPL